MYRSGKYCGRKRHSLELYDYLQDAKTAEREVMKNRQAFPCN